MLSSFSRVIESAALSTVPRVGETSPRRPATIRGSSQGNKGVGTRPHANAQPARSTQLSQPCLWIARHAMRPADHRAKGMPTRSDTPRCDQLQTRLPSARYGEAQQGRHATIARKPYATRIDATRPRPSARRLALAIHNTIIRDSARSLRQWPAECGENTELLANSPLVLLDLYRDTPMP